MAQSQGEGRATPEQKQFTITLENTRDYEFVVQFDKDQFEQLTMDEPKPLGAETGPNASRFLAAAVGNCLSASFLFCARKARADIESVRTEVTVQYTRNEQGRLRIGKIDVEIDPRFDAADAQKVERCRNLFEDFCVVTQSVRKGIDVSVSLKS